MDDSVFYGAALEGIVSCIVSDMRIASKQDDVNSEITEKLNEAISFYEKQVC